MFRIKNLNSPPVSAMFGPALYGQSTFLVPGKVATLGQYKIGQLSSNWPFSDLDVI